MSHITSIINYVSADQWAIARMIGLTLAVVAAVVALFKLAAFLFVKVIDRKITENSGKWFKDGIRLRNIKIMSAAKVTGTMLLVTKITRYAVYALLLYVALPMIFAIFPQTRPLAVMLLSWITTPLLSMAHGFVAYLPKLLRIIVIIAVMRYLLRFLRYISREVEAGRLVIPGFYADWAHATYNLLRIFIVAFTVVLIFPLLPESESAVFRGVSVFIGVLFSIGSSSVVANMMAGMVITYMRSFRLGDRIKVGEVTGDVIEKTLFVVRVETVKNEIVTIPNSTILASNVVNYSTAAREDGFAGVIIYQTISIGYDVTAERAAELLVEAALMTEHVLREPRPFVLVESLGNSAANYQINAYTKRADMQTRILSDINRHLFAIFLREGVDPSVSQYYRIAKTAASPASSET